MYIYEPESCFRFCFSQEGSHAWPAGCRVPAPGGSCRARWAGATAASPRGTAGSLSCPSEGWGPGRQSWAEPPDFGLRPFGSPFSPVGRPRPRGGWRHALFLPDRWAGGLGPSLPVTWQPSPVLRASPLQGTAGRGGSAPPSTAAAPGGPLCPWLPPQIRRPPPRRPLLSCAQGHLGLHRFRAAGCQPGSLGVPQPPHPQRGGSRPARRRCRDCAGCHPRPGPPAPPWVPVPTLASTFVFVAWSLPPRGARHTRRGATEDPASRRSAHPSPLHVQALRPPCSIDGETEAQSAGSSGRREWGGPGQPPSPRHSRPGGGALGSSPGPAVCGRPSTPLLTCAG